MSAPYVSPMQLCHRHKMPARKEYCAKHKVFFCNICGEHCHECLEKICYKHNKLGTTKHYCSACGTVFCPLCGEYCHECDATELCYKHTQLSSAVRKHHCSKHKVFFCTLCNEHCSECDAIPLQPLPIVKPPPTEIQTIALCGCDRHQIDLLKDDVAFYKNRWWLMRCLRMKTDNLLAVLVAKYNELTSKCGRFEKENQELRPIRAKYIKAKAYIKTLGCEMCGKAVGNRWMYIGNSIYCGQCYHENGGEG